jgi:hypothetical protein
VVLEIRLCDVALNLSVTHSENHTRVSFDERWDWFRACANEYSTLLHSGNGDVDSSVSQSAITQIDCKVSH